MAKKRRLSKRDRKIKLTMKAQRNFFLSMEDIGFRNKLYSSIQDIDPSFSGDFYISGREIKYVFFDGEDIIYSWDVAYLLDGGLFIYSRPFSDSEEPF